MSIDLGGSTTLTLTMSVQDGTTNATLAVTDPAGNHPGAPSVTGTGATRTAIAGPLTVAGDWIYTWTVTGTGAGTKQDIVTVEPALPLDAATATNIRQVRLLIADTDPANRIFTTSQVLDFLLLEGNDVRLAAAQALDTIASNEVMVSKVIKTQDLSTDGSKVSAELRARATGLRDQSDEGYGSADGGFEIVDFDPYDTYNGGQTIVTF